MKRSKLKKQLKAESDRFVPDPFDKIAQTIEAEELQPSETKRKSNAARREKSARAKRRNIAVFASVSAAAVCLAIVLPVALGGGSEPLSPLSVRLSAENSYGIGAVTTVKLLDENTASARSRSAINFSASDETAVKSQAKKFNRYFSALDSFLGDEIVSTSTTENTDEAYPYETKMTIDGKNFDGETVEYVMYYTETPEKYQSDDKKTKSKYSLDGVMVMDGTEYFLEGKRTEETEKYETESELEIRAYADVSDRNSYIEMAQEISAETKKGKTEYETEYVYSVYENGKRVEETAVKFESEQKDGKEKTKIELEFRSGDAKGKYEVKRESEHGETEIKVEYEIDGGKGEFSIRERNDGDGGKYEYRFSDNETLIL